MRQIPESSAGPQPARPKKQSSFQEPDVFTRIHANLTLRGVGEIPRPRQDAANLCSAASHERGAVDPAYTPILAPELHEAPLAHRRACETAGAGQGRNGGRALALFREAGYALFQIYNFRGCCIIST